MEITKENAKAVLLEHRREKNITQLEISKKADISLPTISGIEAGKLTPQSMTVFKLQRYFDSLG
jgi:DNA-binding XRE family transcriptional regulator